MPIPRNIRDLPGYGGRTQGVAARGRRRPAGGARTSRDGPGGGPGIPSLARRRRRPSPEDEVPMAPPGLPDYMGIGGLVQRLQGGGPAQVGLGGMGRPGMGQQLQAPPMMPPGMPPGMAPPGMPPPGGMGLQGMGQQQRQPMGGPQQQAMAGAQRQAMGMGLGGMGQQRQPMGMGMGRPGMDQQRRDMGQQLSARSQLAGAQPGRAATRGIGPGMAYGGVPRLALGDQVPGPGGPPGGLPPSPMAPGMPPLGIPSGGPTLGGGNRLDALRGAIPGELPLAGGPEGDVIEEEGGTEGLPGAIFETVMANTGGDPFQTLEILDEAVRMAENELPEDDTGGVPDIGAILGEGGGGSDIEALLGGGGGPDPMAMV